MAHLIVKDRRLLRCPGTRKLSVCTGVDPCGPPSDLLCVVECAKELAGCPECIAFRPEALPYYPSFDYFRWDNRCWHVTGPFVGEPVCIVEEPPFAIVPAVGPCGVGCVDSCPERPCICGGTDMPDIFWPSVDLTNATARVSVQVDTHGSCVLDSQTGIVSGSRASLSYDVICRSLAASSVGNGLRIEYNDATDDLLSASYVGTGRYIHNQCDGRGEECVGQSYGLSDFLGSDGVLGMQLVFFEFSSGACDWRISGGTTAEAGRSDFNCQSCPGYSNTCDTQEMASAVDATAQGTQPAPLVTGTPIGGTGVADMGWWYSDDGVQTEASGRVTLSLTIPSLGAACAEAFDCVPVVTPGGGGTAPPKLGRNTTGTGDFGGGTGGRPGDGL
jgi:hypothetical protein